ncbi:HAD family hydrolase [Saccharospirillum impatiens]|uniref:HAD family hydrolase n=1 Tax=Saccharospirillum impatiens TaxID=169438 RepID=UPI00040043C1|nr:HAD family phosphatase [Saccharospirillum impatiens]
MALPELDAVLWDMDGVLLDSERLVQAVFTEVMANGGPVPDAERRYLETIGLNRAGLIQWFLSYVDSADSAEYWIDQTGDRYTERAKTELVLKPGVVESLEHVARSGRRQMVVTSTRLALAEAKLERAGLRGYFESLLGGDQVTRGKPHPEPYLAGCTRLEVAPARSLVVEDSANGVLAGLAAGCNVLHVPDLLPTDPKWAGQLAATLTSLEAFPGWLDGAGSEVGK